MMYSLRSIVAILIIFSFALTCKSHSCCLRTKPVEALNDGLYLQKLLLTHRRDRNKDLWFLPNAPLLIGSQIHRKLIEDLLILVRLRLTISREEAVDINMINDDAIDGSSASWITAKEEMPTIRPTSSVTNILLASVINDSCVYLNNILKLEEEMNCNDITEVEYLLNKLQLTNSAINLYDTIEKHRMDGVLDFPKGRSLNRYSYWKLKVKDTCVEGCSNFDKINREVLRFNSYNSACFLTC